MFYKVDRIYC